MNQRWKRESKDFLFLKALHINNIHIYAGEMEKYELSLAYKEKEKHNNHAPWFRQQQQVHVLLPFSPSAYKRALWSLLQWYKRL